MVAKRILLSTAAIVAFGMATTAANAGYYVETSANTGNSYNRGCAAQYNIGGTGARFINNSGGGSPCDPSAFASFQTVTVSGSTDTTGTLTKANDSSTVTAIVGVPDAAVATAAADLKTGKIQLTASAAGPLAGANASGRLNDTLHFTIAGATATTVTYVPISFAFGGTLPGTSNPQVASGDLLYGFSFGNAAAYEFGYYGAGNYGNYGNYPTFVFPPNSAIVRGFVSSSFASYTPLDTRFTGIYAITGATADIPVDFNLQIDAANVALDYSLGGSIHIGSVAGVSYTSDSGVFLTGGASTVGGVPEPASWALMVAGFGIVGAAARRRRNVVAA